MTWIALAVALLTSLVAQSPALDSDFRFDDFQFFFQASDLPLLDFMLRPHAGHLLLARNTLYAGSYALFELSPKPYFIQALAAHALNVALLFYALRVFTRRTWIACAVAAFWGMSPTHQGSLNWVTQFAGVLAGTFLLVILADLARHAQSERRPSLATGAFWALMLTGAATSWGSGLVAALMLPAIAWLCMPDACGRLRTALLLGVSVVPVLIAFVLIPDSGPKVALMVSLKAPIALLVEIFAKLVAYGAGMLWLGPFGTIGDRAIVTGPLSGRPPVDALDLVVLTTIPLIALLGVTWLRADALARRRILAFAMLTVGSYAVIVVTRVGVLLAFDANPVIVVQTHRYHYLPLIGIALCSGYVLVELERMARRIGSPRLARLGLVPLLLALAAVTPSFKKSARHIDQAAIAPSRALLAAELQRIDRELERRVPGQPLYIENDPSSRNLMLMGDFLPRASFPGSVAVFMMAYREAREEPPQVFFVERDVELVKELRVNPERRIARLLVTPDEAAAAGALLPGAESPAP